MTARRQVFDRTPDRIATFIDAFFGAGNTVNKDPSSSSGRGLVPFLQVLYSTSDVPVVLPRRRPGQEDRLIAYVIALDAAHATAVAELLNAFVGPSYTYFDGRPARLDPTDPVDRAVLEFAGPGTAFTLTSPIRDKDGQIWAALQLMQRTVARRPSRTWHVPKPVGRLLAEFDTALAAGDHSASVQVLEQLTASGGLSGLNLAHLRIKRLARLGRDSELLRLPDLTDVAAAHPPTPVCDAVLTAIYTGALAGPLTTGDLAVAQAQLIDQGMLVPVLMRGSLDGLGAQSMTVLALAAWVRNDATVARNLLTDPAASQQIGSLAPAVLAALAQAHAFPAHAVPPVDAVVAAPPDGDQPAPSQWQDLVAALADARDNATTILANEHWRGWAPPVAVDQQLAALLGELDDIAAERVWSMVGAFLDADGYRQPAACSAYELIKNALTYSRFSPGDLAGLVALTEIALRAAPGRTAYARLLDDLRAECDRWVSPERSTVALDFADLLVRAACPDQEARLRLAIALLEPLWAHHNRLESEQAIFASQLSHELHTDLVWPPTSGSTDATDTWARVTGSKVLLYSLDTGALTRTSEALGQFVPDVKITLSHDRVGSPQLKQHARHADVIVLATRCATHAATGLIRANASKDATVTEADGSGSASLLRAAAAGLQSRAARRAR